VSRALFLDTETTGLSGGAGTVAFLVGLGRVEGEEFVVYQYLMPSYAAESLLLEKAAHLIDGCDVMVTFNGKSFDIPLLQSRFVMARRADATLGKGHIDLIHPSRRLWKLRLRDCSLSHLEESVLGVHREHDLPGSQVPERYFSFLRTGDFSLLEDIVLHNRQDIVSLGDLLVRLNHAYAEPLRQTSMMDVLSLGKSLEKQGDRQTAAACYRLAAKDRSIGSIQRLRERHVSGDAKARLSNLLRREGHSAEAEMIWRDMAARKQGGIAPLVELAKLYEHQRRDYAVALSYTLQALALADEAEKPALGRREARLRARLNRIRQEK